MTPNITETATGTGREVLAVIEAEADQAIEGVISRQEIPVHDLRHPRALSPPAGRTHLAAAVIPPPDLLLLATPLVRTLEPTTTKACTLSGSPS